MDRKRMKSGAQGGVGFERKRDSTPHCEWREAGKEYKLY